MTRQIFLSVARDPTRFAEALGAHAAALAAHRAGRVGVPAPRASDLIDSLVVCVRRGDPHPDEFRVCPYTIVDDTPRAPEVSTTLAVLRETLSSKGIVG